MPRATANADARRRRRADDVRRCRARQRRGAACYVVEVDAPMFDLMEQFGGLRAEQVDDRPAVNDALGRLLRLALQALVREQHHL